MEPYNTVPAGQRSFHALLWIAAGLTVIHLVLTASPAALLAAILILIMIWGILRGDDPLTRALSIVLILYGTVNLIVLGVILLSRTETQVSAFIWTGCYSMSIIALGALMRSKKIRAYWSKAKPPSKTKSRFHFFHGGWRDL